VSRGTPRRRRVRSSSKRFDLWWMTGQMYLPATVTVPQYGETPITLLDLATHTSGLPRLPDNLNPSSDPANPYADYTVAKLYSFLSKYKPTRASGAQYEYSNLGVGLLGYLLSLRAGQSYEDLVVSLLCDPLGLKSTRFHLSPELHSRLVPGHDASGHPVPNWEFTPALAGAGALRSSAHDMLQYVAANLDLSAPRLKAAMPNTHAARHRVDAGQAILYVALGWLVLNVNGAEIIWHNGGTACRPPTRGGSFHRLPSSMAHFVHIDEPQQNQAVAFDDHAAPRRPA
jgi:serine-type D-Ala-D-Ala carboxypeptidase/endopeptidase